MRGDTNWIKPPPCLTLHHSPDPVTIFFIFLRRDATASLGSRPPGPREFLEETQFPQQVGSTFYAWAAYPTHDVFAI